jgi:hypothetical protein
MKRERRERSACTNRAEREENNKGKEGKGRRLLMKAE